MAFLKPKHEVLYSFTEKIMFNWVIRKWHLLPRVNVNSQQRMQFETYPLGSTIAQLWQLLTQLPSTNPTPSCQVSSIPMDQIWMLEISLGVYNSGTMTFSSIMSKCLSGYRPKMLKGLIERETERPFTCALASNSITLSRLLVSNLQCACFSVQLFRKKQKILQL